jgi:mevalonate pyrophosphate decarboxylase
MKALLLADEKTVLFSTDAGPEPVIMVDNVYHTNSCACGIQDMACRCW